MFPRLAGQGQRRAQGECNGHALALRLQGKAVGGSPSWSDALWVPSGAAELPNTPQSLALVDGSLGATSCSSRSSST